MLHPEKAPAKSIPALPKKSYAISFDDAGGFDVYLLNHGHLPDASGRWRGVDRPAVLTFTSAFIVTDGSIPIGLWAAEEALRRVGRLDLLRPTYRVDDLFTCPHCGEFFKQSRVFSDHLRLSHSNGGAAIAAWWADFPGRTQIV